MLLESTRITETCLPALEGWRAIEAARHAPGHLPASCSGLTMAFDPDFLQAAARVPARACFTALERAAVRLGARDTPASLQPPSRWQRVKFLVFGFTPATPLSNPRLEAMRRLVVELRHSCGSGLAPIHARGLASGISAPQIRALIRRFVRHRRRWWQVG